MIRLKWEFVDGLEKRFTRVFRQTEYGKILLPEAPIPLVEVIVCEDEEEEECRREDPEGLASEYGHELATDMADGGIFFVWEGFYTWQASLILIYSGECTYACVNLEVDLVGQYLNMCQLVACLDPRGNLELESEFYLSYLSRNGRDYGVEIMGSLPSTFDTWGVGPGVLHKGFRQAMEFGVEEYGWLWQDVLEEVQRRLDGVSPRDWLLNELSKSGGKETLLEQLEQHYDENRKIGDGAKDFIMDCYFQYS